MPESQTVPEAFVLLGKDRLQVTKLKVSKSLSRETTAYTADIIFDGVTFFASNNGSGGADLFTPAYDRKTDSFKPGSRYAIDAAERWARTICPDNYEALAEVIARHIYIASVRKDCKKHICYVLGTNDDHQGGYHALSGPPDDAARAWVAKTHPNAIIINDLPDIKEA